MSIQAALVRAVLEKWGAYEWTIQGFGFIRTKLADVGRIHVWDSRLRVDLVSDIHSHPWPLRSTIISGELINVRFKETDYDDIGLPYQRMKIKTGEGGGPIDGTTKLVRLILDQAIEFYIGGDSYQQAPIEVHRSMPQDGTVTLLERPMGPPLEEAIVYWPRGTAWVSAEPRPAESWEVQKVVDYALARWDVTA